MLHLARLSIRRPVLALLTWAVLAGGLIAIGSGVADRLSPSVVVVPGTEASRAEHLARAQFGPSVLVPVLLEGPARRLDRQGPALVRALSARPDTRVLSAWDGGATGASLRPRRTAAMVVAAVARREKAMVTTVQPQIDRTVARVVHRPVRASITGQPTLDRGFKDAAIDATRDGVLLSVPILFAVLLLVLRAPLGAAGLSLLAGATSLAGLGVMALLGKVVDVDPTALTVGVAVGLALASAYGLVLWQRWRAELPQRAGHVEAARAAVTSVETTGRGVLIGGTALIVALVVASQIGPSKVLLSLGIGAVLMALLSIGAAVVVLPAALTLLGRRALWLSFPAPRVLAAPWERLVAGGGWVVRNAAPAGAAATAALAALIVPLGGLETGPPSAALLPPDAAARVSFERVSRVMGPGWPTPYNIVVASTTGAITDPALLGRLDRFQRALARDPRVASVVGPGQFAAVSRQLGVLPKQLEQSAKLLKGGKRDLSRLQAGLGQAGAGAATLREGLGAAAAGAGRLQGGSGQARSGAGRLRAGLDQARDGAQRISAGLDDALAGARALRDGAAKALAGSEQVTGGLGEAATPVRQGLPIVRQMAADIASGSAAVKGAQSGSGGLLAQLDQAAAAVQALPAGPERDAALGAIGGARQAAADAASTLAAAAPKIEGAAVISAAFADQVAKLSTGLDQLYAGSTQLQQGIGQLRQGNGALAAGIDRLAGGGGELTTGLGALRDGAAQLEAGLGQLTTGSGTLAGALAGGTGPTGQLVSGLGQMQAGVAKFRGELPSTKDLERLQAQSPGLFESGYFVLAAIQGAPPAQRNQASFAVNLSRGGNAGQIVVVSKRDAAAPSTQELGEALKRRVDAFAAATHTQAAVGGPAGALGDFTSSASARIWAVVGGVAVALALLLMVLLRAVLLPLVAVAFDLLVAGATFGILTLLLSGEQPPLGGPGYVDPVSIIEIFAGVVGIGAIYEVQLLVRTRELFRATGDAHGALRAALRDTAGPGTGAALAMLATLIPFALTDLMTIRVLAVGIAIAIALDALIVRPVLLPAAAEVLGRAAWWPTSRRVPARPLPPVAAAPPAGRPASGSPA